MVSLLVATVRESHNSFPNLLPHIFTLERISFVTILIGILIGMSLRTLLLMRAKEREVRSCF